MAPAQGRRHLRAQEWLAANQGAHPRHRQNVLGGGEGCVHADWWASGGDGAPVEPRGKPKRTYVVKPKGTGAMSVELVK